MKNIIIRLALVCTLLICFGTHASAQKFSIGTNFFDWASLGTGNIELHSGDKINISTSCCTTRLIRLSRRSFLETLHKKITS